MALDRALAQACFSRDRWKCRHCGSRNGLHPHHLVYKSHQGPDTLDNLITLCAACHRGHHDGKLGIKMLDTDEGGPIIQFTRKGNWKPF